MATIHRSLIYLSAAFAFVSLLFVASPITHALDDDAIAIPVGAHVDVGEPCDLGPLHVDRVGRTVHRWDELHALGAVEPPSARLTFRRSGGSRVLAVPMLGHRPGHRPDH